MTATLTPLRTLVLAFLLLAGTLGTVLASPAQEAAAAGPCWVISNGYKSVSNGYYVVNGAGSTGCNYNVSQSIGIYLYANGTLVRSTSSSIYGTGLAARTSAVLGRCGTRYQVATVHAVRGYSNTTTWYAGFYLC
jgi:hypothetical protein